MVDNIYIGLMTGTSADSLDCAAVNFSKKEINIIGLKNYDIPTALKQKIQESSQALELNESLIKDLDIKLGYFFSESIKDLIKTLSLDKNQVSGIGSHGQTIKHEPNAENPYSMQIGDPQLISNNLGIKTVGRFRDDDILAGGQGAPISPVFHREVFAQTGEKRLIVNIGGITNISVISDQEIMGFDTGPGNCLMDTWCRKNLKGDFDDEGNWAKSGEVNKTLLDFMIDDNYFKKEHPKSTGPDYFNESWLLNCINEVDQDLNANDVQATLAELTALSLSMSLNEIEDVSEKVYFCGGGTHNLHLLKRINLKIKKTCLTTQELGIDPDYLEAICFAWLAKQRLDDRKFDMQNITGSKKAVYLGRVFLPAI